MRTVLFSIPGIAPVTAAMGNPLALGGTTIAAALLVVWAFWPRDRRRRAHDAAHSRHGRGAAAVVAVLALADPSYAAANTEVIQGKYVRLVSVVDWSQAERLQPGDAVRWDVDVSAEAPEPGTLAVGVSASGWDPARDRRRTVRGRVARRRMSERRRTPAHRLGDPSRRRTRGAERGKRGLMSRTCACTSRSHRAVPRDSDAGACPRDRRRRGDRHRAGAPARADRILDAGSPMGLPRGIRAAPGHRRGAARARPPRR